LGKEEYKRLALTKASAQVSDPKMTHIMEDSSYSNFKGASSTPFGNAGVSTLY
jgi:hypothetical protein